MIKTAITIRNVPVIYLEKIDKYYKEVARKTGKKFSRNDYILMIIKSDYDSELQKIKEDKFDRSINNLTLSLDRLENKIQENIDSNSALVKFLIYGEGGDIK